jgi:hypothetical protein
MSSTNYKKATMQTPPVDIDRSQYQHVSEKIQRCSSTTSNKPTMRSHTKNFNKLNFRSLGPINSSASENADCDQHSVVSDYFHTSSGKIGEPSREL